MPDTRDRRAGVYTETDGTPWCHRAWTAKPIQKSPSDYIGGYYAEINRELCKSCKNHLLKLGGGRCWELNYEQR